MIENPCRNCVARYPACHDNCVKHIIYNSIRRRRKEKIQESMKECTDHIYKPNKNSLFSQGIC
ncbi:hypothetical protein OCV67_13000 [Porcipelethomonas ammoniilytica]|uniref:hypothetical protein n=1 Tax=Porcipelethomonas ammoniilytica TaxID=2981722 RepID=UPI0011CC5895|nr:hypothetical protein [Porcipelethomonas ammoniilytica]MCU6720837.1 hypothetical protein [Porcipelethomonas ammoniilytica]